MSIDSSEFWALPGPRRFVNGIREHIARRTSLLIEVPATVGPADLVDAVADRMGGRWRHRIVAVDRLPPDAFLDPTTGVLTLIKALGLPVPDGDLAIGPLAEEGLAGWTLWLDARRCDDHHLVGGIIETAHEVARALKNRQDRRPVLVIELAADSCPELQSSSSVQRLPWLGVIDHLDTMMYVRQRADVLLARRDPFRQAQVAELAGYDLDLVDELLHGWSGVPDELAELLAATRDKRGWEVLEEFDFGDSTDRLTEAHTAAWGRGWLDVWSNGRLHPSSAVLPLTGVLSLSQRLIASQARTLFAELEAEVLGLAHWADSNQLIPKAELDLSTADISHLSEHFGRYVRLRYPEQLARAQSLEGIRHAISHRNLLVEARARLLFP